MPDHLAKPAVSLTYPMALVRSPEPPPGVRRGEMVDVPMRDGIRLGVYVYCPERRTLRFARCVVRPTLV